MAADTIDPDFETLFRTHYQGLVVFASTYLHDMEESRDVVQDVFVALHDKRSNDITHYKAYLFRSVYNACMDRLNKREVSRKYLATLENGDLVSFEPEIEASEREVWLLQCIEELPDKCRQVLKLSRFEGKKYVEIAEILSISKRTVEVHISKALRILREKAGGKI